MQCCYHRLVIAALLAAAFVMQTCLHQATADPAGPIIPLPDSDRAQLDRLLGKGVVGEALPSPPLAGIEAYLPPKNRVMTLRVVTSDKQMTTETHRIEATTDAAFAPGWQYTIEGLPSSISRKILAAYPHGCRKGFRQGGTFPVSRPAIF